MQFRASGGAWWRTRAHAPWLDMRTARLGSGRAHTAERATPAAEVQTTPQALHRTAAGRLSLGEGDSDARRRGPTTMLPEGPDAIGHGLASSPCGRPALGVGSRRRPGGWVAPVHDRPADTVASPGPPSSLPLTAGRGRPATRPPRWTCPRLFTSARGLARGAGPVGIMGCQMIGQRGPRDRYEFAHGTVRLRPTNQTCTPLHRTVPQNSLP